VNIPQYKFRFFFSPGSGTCLWVDNDAASERWDCAVDINDLPLTDQQKYQALYVIAWYDTSIDWDYPPGPSPWSNEELLKFNNAAQSLLVSFQTRLGSGNIRDLSDTGNQT